DTVRGYLAASEAVEACGEVIQLGTGSGTKISEVVAMVEMILGRKLDVATDSHRQRPGKSEVRQLICSPAKAGALLNWRSEVDLETGLRQTVEWIDAHRADYRADQYSV